MLFNTLKFFVFFIVIYTLYILLRKTHKWQNRFLLVASYFFYGSWDWRFLSLLIFSTLLDYFCGLRIYNSQDLRKKKLFLFFSIFGNLSVLTFFKYFNFFSSTLRELLSVFGFQISPSYLNIILPIGISFYTFQTMSYTIDIYRGDMKPTRKFIDFALFVAFFPQLVAGPIERARRLLPQILNERKLTVEKLNEGFFLIAWGLFKKVFVADNLARIVNLAFSHYLNLNGSEVLITVYAFAIQVYCDFSGYSDIARGLGKCMGFEIMINFNLPYLSKNIREFWRRWHISLSSWLRDYLYIPLGGNRGGKIRTYRNIMITMLLGGLWHGAAWNFVIFGAYFGIILIIYRMLEEKIKLERLLSERVLSKLRIAVTFHFTSFGLLIFRSDSLKQITAMFHTLFFNFSFSPLAFQWMVRILFFSWVLVLIEFFQYKRGESFLPIKQILPIRVALYLYIWYSTVIFGVTGGKEFIYFQF